MNWQERNGVLLKVDKDFDWKEAVVCVSVDGCLAKTRTGRSTPRNEKDWVLLYDNVISKLKEIAMYASIVILTHDKKIGSGKISKAVYCRRLDRILGAIGIPNVCIIGIKSNCFSKPYTRLWLLLRSLYTKNSKILPNTSKSVYIGEMGGHLASRLGSVWGPQPKDASYYDRAFASNVGIRYWSPDVLFNFEKYDSKLNPKNYPLKPAPKKNTESGSDTDSDASTTSRKSGTIADLLGPTISRPAAVVTPGGGLGSVVKKNRIRKKDKIPFRQWSYGDALSTEELKDYEIDHKAGATSLDDIKNIINKCGYARICVMLVGCPGSGKSTLATNIASIIEDRNISRRDMFATCMTIGNGTHKSMLRDMKSHVKGGADIIIDTSLPSSAIRGDFIKIIEKYGSRYSLVIIRMIIADRLAQHLTHYRVQESSDFSIEAAPDSAYILYNKKYQDPSPVEYKSETYLVKFIPSLPSDKPSFWYVY